MLAFNNFEYAITSFFSITFSIAMLMMLLFGWKLSQKNGAVHKEVINVIFFFAIYKVLAYYFFPAVMRITSDYQFVRDDQVDLSNLMRVYEVEFFSWIPWLAALFIIFIIHKKTHKYKHNSYRSKYERIKMSKKPLVALVCCYIIFNIYKMKAIADTSGGGDSGYFETIKALLTYCGPPSSVLLIVLGFKYWSKTHGILGILGMLLSISILSTRGSLIYSIIFLFYAIITYANKTKYIIYCSSILIILAITYFISGGLPASSISIGEDGNIIIDASINEQKKGDRSAIDELEWRFGAATRMSTSFIKMYDRGDAAGIKPIQNSLFGFLPRSINPNKPHPSTLDGNDIYSQGMYLIYREIHGYKTYTMTEFSTGAHSYWEFGWIGVILLNAISGIYIAICALYFQRFGVISVPLMVGTFKPWGYVDPKIWVSDIVTQIYQIIIPLVFIVSVLSFIKICRRTFSCSLHATSEL